MCIVVFAEYITFWRYSQETLYSRSSLGSACVCLCDEVWVFVLRLVFLRSNVSLLLYSSDSGLGLRVWGLGGMP